MTAGNIFDVLIYVIFIGLPFVVLVFGIVLMVRKTDVLIGVALCIPAVLFCAFLPDLGLYGYLKPYVEAFSGVLLVIAGMHDRKRRDKRREISFHVIAICVGAVTALVYPVIMLTNCAVDTGRSNKFAKEYPVWAVFMDGSVDDLKAVLESGADPRELINGAPIITNTLLYKRSWLAERPEQFEKVTALVAAGYDVNESGEYGETLLMLASIDARWDYDIHDPFDMPTKLTELFIAYGADVNARDDYGRTALMWACCYKGYYYMFDINADTSPLISHSSTRYSGMDKRIPVFYYGQIRALVDAGADVLAQDSKGFTALDYFEFSVELSLMLEREEETDIYQSMEYIESCEAIRELLKK